MPHERGDDPLPRADQPHRALRRAVGRARRQLHHRHARAARRRPGALPDHPDRHRPRRPWALAAGAQPRRWPKAPTSCPATSTPPATRSSPADVLGAAADGDVPDRRAAAPARPDGRGRHGAGPARAGRRALRRRRRARLGGRRWTRRWPSRCSPRNGIAQARYVALRERRAHAVDAGRAWPTSSACRVFVKPANMGARSASARPRRSRPCATRSRSRSTYDEWVLVEEAIVGREIEVAVLGNRAAAASVPGEIVPGAEFYDYADKYVDDGSQALVPAPAVDRPSPTRCAPSRCGCSRRCVRRPGPRRLLLRGGRPRLVVQRDQHDARVHPDLDVPEAVAGDGHVLPGADRRAGPPGARAPRPPPAAHRPLTMPGETSPVSAAARRGVGSGGQVHPTPGETTCTAAFARPPPPSLPPPP